MEVITENYLKSKGFKHVHGNAYKLEIKLPYEGKRLIEADKLERYWIAYYMVNDVPASIVFKTEKEIETLYLGVTGNELKEI